MCLLRKTKKGSALVLTIIILAVVVILGAGLLSVVLASYNRSLSDHEDQQLYYTTRSALDAAVAGVKNGSADDALRLARGTSSRSVTSARKQINGMGEAQITYTYPTAEDDILYVAATGYYNGESRTMRAKLRYEGETGTSSEPDVPPAPPAQGIPYTEQLFTAGGDQNDETEFEQSYTQGDVYFRGDITLQSGTVVDGDVRVTGSAELKGNVRVTGDMHVYGDLTLANSATIEGSVYVHGGLLFSNGNAAVKGNAFVDGELSLQGGRIGGDASVGGKSVYLGWSGNITGNLTCLNSAALTAQGGTSVRVGGKVYRVGAVDPAKVDADPGLTLPVLEIPTQEKMPELYNHTVVLTNGGLVNTSGRLDASRLGQNTKVTFDAREHDLFLLVDRDFEIPQNTSFISVGKYRIVLYFINNASMEAKGNNFVGHENMEDIPQFYFMGMGKTEIDFDSTSSLQGFCFLPNGKLSLEKNGMHGYPYKFCGSAVVDGIEVEDNVKLIYRKPDYSGLGLVSSAGGGTSSGGTSSGGTSSGGISSGGTSSGSGRGWAIVEYDKGK